MAITAGEPPQCRWPLRQRTSEDLGGRTGLEGTRARQHLEEHRAERVEVAPGVNRLAENLLGRHVAWCSEHRARQGQFGTVCIGVVVVTVGAARPKSSSLTP